MAFTQSRPRTRCGPKSVYCFKIASDKEIVGIKVDPRKETADVNEYNNTWPRRVQSSKFDKFKNKIKG